MTLGEILYKILIGPLELFFEAVFVTSNRYVNNPAYAIIMLSLAMNFLVLPLYRRADALQAEQRDREAKLAPWIAHIKKTFKGDERFMMLQAYYRQNNYKPTDSLKGSVSLFLEVPFFIAAYHFLSHLETIRKVSFGPIADLGAPDALIQIGSMTVNLLPILMTLINVISAAIYMKGFPLKSKIQMYGVAVIFLVFLYNSPAGLVFYWTLNNIFSLIKNIFYKLKDPAGVLRIMASAVGAVLLVFILFIHPISRIRTQIIFIIMILMLQLPLLMNILSKRGHTVKLPEGEGYKTLFYSSCALLTVVTGLLIPSTVIRGSAAEFIDIVNYVSPLWYIVSALALAVGTFIVWFGIFFSLASKPGKKIMSLLLAVAAAAGLMDYMAFGKNYGNFSPDLQFDMTPQIGFKAMLINLAAVMAVFLVVAVIWTRKRSFLSMLAILSCIALVGMSTVNVVGISGEIKESKRILEAAGADEPEITLSKDGKNVVVIMMDRQIGYLVPFLMHEDPKMAEQFAGFTYYRNSLSFGPKTNFGAPGLFGGYDYTPEKLNERDKELLMDKHDEALKVMPEIFGDAGYQVTLFDPTYAGYSWIPDLSIFEDHPEYRTYLVNDRFSLPEYGYNAEEGHDMSQRFRNFFCYSLFKIAPQVIQPTLYQHGSYNAQGRLSGDFIPVWETKSKGKGYNREYMAAYAVLRNMPAMTVVDDSDTNQFFMMSNDTTHEPNMLKEPEYVLAPKINNKKYDNEHPVRVDDEGNELPMKDKKTVLHYQINMAAMRELGNWMDCLRDKGVYDNTRIIIVSDHGHNILNKEEIKYNKLYYLDKLNEFQEEPFLNIMSFNSVLLVKDFGADEFTTDNTLTMNADVPAIATRDLIKDAKNPFTGSKLTTYQESPVDIDMIYSHRWSVQTNNGNTFLPADWFRFSGDDIYDVKNWKYLGWK